MNPSGFAYSFLQPTPRDIDLAVQLKLPPIGRVEDLHLQVDAPCRAHNEKRGHAYWRDPLYSLVPGPGFEPGTLGFSVRCSTD